MTNQAVSKPGTIKQIFTIARNTFREAVRDRVLYNLVLFVLMITASADFSRRIDRRTGSANDR
jgi:hypothetical protein